MDIKETIKSWRWRIVRAGHNGKTFSELIGISNVALSEYISGKKKPSLDRFDMIEKTILEAEKKQGLV